jgi:predicted glycogen debranching enzyme
MPMRLGVLRVLSDREWILTNGLGGYALGFGSLINKRKYNGLLVAAAEQQRRIHMLASIEEKVEGGGNIFFLDSNHYSNCIHPNGYAHIVGSWLRPAPAVLYSSVPACEDNLLLKEIFFCPGRNAVVVVYTNRGTRQLDLTLRPKFTLRDHHAVNTPGTWDRVAVEHKVTNSSFFLRRSDNGYQAYGYAPGGEIWEDFVIYRSVYYPMESMRGYEATEDLVAPFRVNFRLRPGRSATLLISDRALELPRKEARRAVRWYTSHPLPAGHPRRVQSDAILKDQEAGNNPLFKMDEYLRILQFAARDFIVGDDIIAGYPWFGAWGRDTMIAMGGLRYLPDGRELAVRVLTKYAGHLQHGLLPNTFGEGGQGLNYDSVDAPLWYVLRCHQFAPRNGELFSAVARILLHYLHDEHHPFFTSGDGLIEIHRGDHALTWMDAKVYGTPITPRWGKPVEINALWYNALRCAVEMAKALGIYELRCSSYACSLEDIERAAKKVKESFQKFVGPDYLADRLENDRPVWEVRPNAVLALSLPYDLVDKEVARRVWVTAKEKLLTPYGLRSLDPGQPAFKQRYVGSQKLRDLAYHQGTTWAFLLLPFARLAWKVLSPEMGREELKKEIVRYIWSLRNGFIKGEMASVAEVWDGADPHLPKGCPAQAWSVLALLEIEHLLMQGEGVTP